MRAVCWHGRHKVRVDNVPDPKILNPHDAIVRVSLTAICGSDLHLFDNFIPTMEKGDILGHEFMGEVVEVGRERSRTSRWATEPSSRSRSPAAGASSARTACSGRAAGQLESRTPWIARARPTGFSASGPLGYSHMFGGYAGGQAEYARVPFADVGPMVKVPEGMERRAGRSS